MLPTCQKCQKRWTWKQMFKKQFNFSGEMTCPYCGEKQYYTKQTKKWSGIISVIAVTIIMTCNLIFGPSYVWLILLWLLLPLYFIVFPFFIRLANSDEF